MELTSHIHTYIFNDDGFEVCNQCGTCSSMRLLKHDNTFETVKNHDLSSPFSNILINHNIGFIEEIEHEYHEIKKKLKRGYPNIVLFAYCTYNVLLKNGIYYSLHKISDIFQIEGFFKHFCQVEGNYIIEKNNFNIKDDKYIYSSFILFLSELYLMPYYSKAVNNSKVIKEYYPRLKFNLHLSMSLYFALKSVYTEKKVLLNKLSLYYTINIRTLIKTMRCIEQNSKIYNLL